MTYEKEQSTMRISVYFYLILCLFVGKIVRDTRLATKLKNLSK